jgi:hypothetical protein
LLAAGRQAGKLALASSYRDRVGVLDRHGLPRAGRYIVPDALGLVDTNRETDTGSYIEEGLWVQHL